MKKHYFFIACLSITACTNLDDADLSPRESFVRFYEGANAFTAAQAIVTPDGGFLIAGTIRIDTEPPQNRMLLIKTDNFGTRQWETILEGGSVSSVLANGDGYIVVGDSVRFANNPDVLSDLENTSARMVRLNASGSVTNDISHYRTVDNGNTHVDFEALAATPDESGNLVTLSTFQRPGQRKFAAITAMNATSLDTVWTQIFDYENRDYVNTRSIYYSEGNLLWGASITETVSNFSKSYLAIPRIESNSTFVNSNYFGEDFISDQQFLEITDLKPATGGGFAGIGTYSQTDGTKANMFFIRVTSGGMFLESSVKYYDFGSGSTIENPGESITEDRGNAITSTRDGGFILAGTTVDPVTRSSDVWVMKTDAAGNPQWSKQFGGRTSESVASVTETEDGGILIFGTIRDGIAESAGLSSLFLIKTDANGELKK